MRERMPAERFAAIWNSAEGPRQVSELTGRSIGSSYAWASQLRRQGFELKHFGRGAKPGAEEKFAREWNASPSIEEYATKLGRSVKSIQVTASTLRGRGHNLKYFNIGIELRNHRERERRAQIRQNSKDRRQAREALFNDTRRTSAEI